MECVMDHIVLNVDDTEEMLTFYSKVLLFTPERLEEYRRGEAPFPSVRLNPDTIIDLFPQQMWREGSRADCHSGKLNHFCLVLQKKAWLMLIQRLEVNKIDIEEGPVPRWGAHGTGISIYFRDPEETLIEARYYEGLNNSEQCLLGS